MNGYMNKQPRHCVRSSQREGKELSDTETVIRLARKASQKAFELVIFEMDFEG